MGDAPNIFFKKREAARRIYDKYRVRLLFDLAAAEKNVVRKEYCRGGECLHRGFYCPSPVFDIVVGGCKRGKLINRPKKAPDHEYWFDKDGNMILAKTPNIPEGFDSSVIGYELIYNYGGSTESVIFQIYPDIGVTISGLAKCSYENGLIRSYDHMSISEEPFFCHEIKNEEFFYNDGVLVSSIMQMYNFDADVFDSDEFFFGHE